MDASLQLPLQQLRLIPRLRDPFRICHYTPAPALIGAARVEGAWREAGAGPKMPASTGEIPNDAWPSIHPCKDLVHISERRIHDLANRPKRVVGRNEIAERLIGEHTLLHHIGTAHRRDPPCFTYDASTIYREINSVKSRRISTNC
jgi:hypothetical protein